MELAPGTNQHAPAPAQGREDVSMIVFRVVGATASALGGMGRATPPVAPYFLRH